MVINVVQINNPRNRRQWVTFPATGQGNFRFNFFNVYSANVAYDYNQSASTNYSAMQTALNGMSTIGVGGSVVSYVSPGVYIIDLDDNLPGADLISKQAPTSGTDVGSVSIYGTNAKVTTDTASQTYLNLNSSTADSLRF